MANILPYKDGIIVGFNKKIYFIDTAKSAVAKSLEIPATLPNIATEDEPQSNKKVEKELYSPTVQHVNISPNGNYLAVTLSGQKYLLLYKVSVKSLELLSQRNLSRVSSALCFSYDSTKLLVSDKTGDCYLFDCVDFNRAGKWILGHLSIVMDIVFTPDEKFIITCDRDEKIRVTKYPETHEIECYCLGHKEYVSCIELLPFEPAIYLLSLSGDKTMKIWEYTVGRKVHQMEIPAPGVKLSSRKVSNSVCQVAVLLYQPRENVLVYQIELERDKFQTSLLSTHCFDPAIVTNLCYGGSSLYLTLVQDNRLNVEIIDGSPTEEISSVKKLVKELYKDDEYSEFEDISLWFKKKFDNVSEYMERKRRRIEEKTSR